MNLPLNPHLPTIMHIDLNSCFATVEQQAYSNLRGKPLVIAAYTTPRGFILAPSIEAKRLGIRMGMTVYDARLLCPSVIVRDPEPSMIRSVHIQFHNILKRYSGNVTPKSIDEIVIDFSTTPYMERDLRDVGQEIKMKIRKEIGEWISCNVGISTNRFLAKLAAGLHKPDGLDVITHNNLKSVYAHLKLIDLPGINVNFERRLNSGGIFTPLAFLSVSSEFLHRRIFKSILGVRWYQRLRGWEVDDVNFSRKSYGQNYALGKQTASTKELGKFLLTLVEKMGRRLRRAHFFACGIHVYIGYRDGTSWSMGKKFSQQLSTTNELYTKALWILGQQPTPNLVRDLSVSCFELIPKKWEQLDLFSLRDKGRKIQEAADSVNNKWGEFTLVSARMMGMKNIILDRIAFGGINEFKEIGSQ